MAKRYPELTPKLIDFIRRQKVFFVATAAADGHVNVSPKGMDTLRVLDSRHAAWLSVTGSGNETAAHVQVNPRMTIMFCAFEDPPVILRLYGTARAVHRCDPEWTTLAPLFERLPGARQIFTVSIDLVQTSCGMGVPYYTYAGDRSLLNDWAVKKGDDGIRRYWREKNEVSIDGIPTSITKKNLA